MPKFGWHKLLANPPAFQGPGSYQIPAYSEFMPAPRCGWLPYGGVQPGPYDLTEPCAWQISEREEIFELRPGLEIIAAQVIGALRRLDLNQPAQGLSRARLKDNCYWPKELAESFGALPQERHLTLMPLALSRTQDDKGRLRWTFFGSSEQGPDRALWRSFYSAPGEELPPEYGVDFVRRLLKTVYAEADPALADLRRLGFRILPGSGGETAPLWKQGDLPSWTAPFLFDERETAGRLRYVLTFLPFSRLPRPVKNAYLAGDVCLLPFPGSLIFWGIDSFAPLSRELPLAWQIPLLNLCDRHEAPRGLRIPQSGWLDELPDSPAPSREQARSRYRRTHRWQRLQRHGDDLAGAGEDDHVTRVLFSSSPDSIGLYGKPMARNSQIWTEDCRLVLDGPRADPAKIARAADALAGGGRFGYRFYFPPMRVGRYEVFWHRPLVAFFDPAAQKPRVMDDAPLGYLTAYEHDEPDLGRPVELWPKRLRRPLHAAASRGYTHDFSREEHQLALNAHKILDVWSLLGKRPLTRGFARRILDIAKDKSLEQWLEQLSRWLSDAGYGYLLGEELGRIVAPPPDPSVSALPQALTYHRSATRAFETDYWNTIAALAEGRFRTKDNADCIADPATRKIERRRKRDLDDLGDFLLDYYRRLFRKGRTPRGAMAGDLPFRWKTDFSYSWMDGWRRSQNGRMAERNLLIVIPGKNRREAVIMADHYDTAYLEDLYYPEKGGKLARLAAAGADDNHSATAALMLAAPIFMELSLAGRLARDIWLVHLTGEEFPSDCMGARHLTQSLVQGSLRLRLASGRRADLSPARIQGVFVADMIAHNREHDLDVFQISPGAGPESMQLAYQAHLANEIWNAGAAQWNSASPRKAAGRAARSPSGSSIPALARHLTLSGEIRPPRDPRSSLYNTDAQIFSDAGVPVVLFMENYDINRRGYHDTQDTMANIDLDYGAALAAIAIESVARTAHKE